MSHRSSPFTIPTASLTRSQLKRGPLGAGLVAMLRPQPPAAGLIAQLVGPSPDEPSVPPPAERPDSYEVRLRDGMQGSVWIVGHNRAGEPMAELRVERKHVTARMVARMRAWCEANDDAPPVSLV